jgi:transcriptional regulator with XRE-family HTH domain
MGYSQRINHRMTPEQIKTYRQSRGLTQTEIAAEFGVNQSTWARWEKTGARGLAATLLRKAVVEANSVPAGEQAAG